MTMRFLVNQHIGSTDIMPRLLFAWLNFMRTASPAGPGWTVPRSCNGTVFGEGDYISSWSDLNVYTLNVARSWFVLRQPDGGREWLFRREATSNAQWAIYVNKLADSSGGGLWANPTGTWVYVTSDDNGGVNVNTITHFAADDSVPYGWWVYSYQAGALSTARWSLSQIPLDVASDPDDDDPAVWYFNGCTDMWTLNGFSNFDPGTYVPYVGAITPGTTSSWNYHQGMQLYSASARVVPNGVNQTVAGKDVTFPIVFARRASGARGAFKGISNWARWNGYPRAIGETYDSKARISLGDVNVPWDGASSMDIS